MRISVNLDQAELNELIYALGMHYQNKLANKEVADPLEDKLRDALTNLNHMVDEIGKPQATLQPSGDLGGGFQNSGVWTTDGMSGFRG